MKAQETATLRGGPYDGDVVSFGGCKCVRCVYWGDRRIYALYTWGEAKDGSWFGKFRGYWDDSLTNRMSLRKAEKVAIDKFIKERKEGK